MKGWIVESAVVRREFQFLAYKYPELVDDLTSALSNIMQREEFSYVPTAASIEDRSDVLRRRMHIPPPGLDVHSDSILNR